MNENEGKGDESFKSFICKWLEPENIKKHLNKNIIVDFEYFLQVLKAVFFWKKIRFQTIKKQMVENRREFLAQGKMTEYKEVNANLNSVEENCFKELL